MSTFNPGTGGTLKSTNLPAALLELCFLVQAAEESIITEDAPERIQITYDSNAKTASVSLELPITRSIASNGQIVEQVAPGYLDDAGFLAAAFSHGDGDLKSTSLVAAMLELTQMVVNAENGYLVAQPEATNIQRTGLDIDANTNTASITASIPFTETVVNGKPTFTAVDYLV